jgi:hypothetical protein
MEKIVFKTKPAYFLIIKLLILSGALFIVISFFKTGNIFNIIIVLLLALVAIVILLKGGFFYHPIIMYEKGILIKRPLFLRFLKTSFFYYNTIDKIQLFVREGIASFSSIIITYTLENNQISTYSFIYTLLDKKTENTLVKILKSYEIDVEIIE